MAGRIAIARQTNESKKMQEPDKTTATRLRTFNENATRANDDILNYLIMNRKKIKYNFFFLFHFCCQQNIIEQWVSMLLLICTEKLNFRAGRMPLRRGA